MGVLDDAHDGRLRIERQRPAESAHKSDPQSRRQRLKGQASVSGLRASSRPRWRSRVLVLINVSTSQAPFFEPSFPRRRLSVRVSRFYQPRASTADQRQRRRPIRRCGHRHGGIAMPAAAKHRPDDARQFVGQRDHGGILVQPRAQSTQPAAKRSSDHGEARRHRPRTVDLQLAQILVAPLPDVDEPWSTARGDLP
jgi:hypothetical protein